MVKLTVSDVRRIREQKAAGVSAKRLALLFGVKVGTIEDVVSRRTWVKVGRRTRRTAEEIVRQGDRIRKRK